MKANAKTAYTSVNAWITQQRVAGVTLSGTEEGNPILIKANGGALSVTLKDGTACSPYAPISALFNAGEFSDTTALEIWTTADYKVTKVAWYEGAESATYPE